MIFDFLTKTLTSQQRVVALGYFDGIHLGHQALLRTTLQEATEHSLRSAVFTFTAKPGILANSVDCKVLKAGRGLLQTTDDRIECLKHWGIEDVIAVPWVKEFYALKPEVFVKEILLDTLQVRIVVCGRDFHFGYQASGDINLLSELAKKYQFELVVVEDITIAQTKISSSLIREYIELGEIEQANQLLGYHYSFTGEVIGGQKLGRKLGFPTLNLAIAEELQVPRLGVYASVVRYGKCRWQSISSIGFRPTVQTPTKQILLETYVYNQELDLYGEVITVELLAFIRAEQHFASVAELVEQVERDKQNVLAYHRSSLHK